MAHLYTIGAVPCLCINDIRRVSKNWQPWISFISTEKVEK